ncbi:MAG: hypothetical protein IJ691_00980 [Lachnospiraceae bacterium]|nr:hypothetical protein [Lachnospiraceae bacterium]
MKISFNNHEINNNKKSEQGQISLKEPEKRENVKGGVRLDLGSMQPLQNNDFFLGKSENNKGGKTLTDLRDEAGSIDAVSDKNYRIVLSNMMSAEDYAKACKEGFDCYKLDPDETVTIIDRIKAEVAKSGEVTVGYNDSLDSEKLAEVLGSETLARSLANAFEKADIPLSDDNVTRVSEMNRLAKSLSELSDKELGYLIANELDLSVWGLYLAKNSATASERGGRESSYGSTFAAGGGINLHDPQNAGMLEQIKGIIDSSEVLKQRENEAVSKARWLIESDLPVTKESLEKAVRLEGMQFPLSDEVLTNTAISAIDGGIRPMDAEIISEGEYETIAQKAVRLEEYYFSERAVSNISSRRLLEEVRLSMTAEVNLKLLESDYFIDTAPIEEFVEKLKEAEKELALKYFPSKEGKYEEAVKNFRLMNETGQAVAEIKSSPAAALGMFTARDAENISVSEFRAEGRTLRDTYEKAGESYEALMTAPRSDLGDSIKKAFGRIESLAKEIGIETTEENLRAIRILGYNSMEISQINVSKITAADTLVRGVIDKMTPASVLEMIRDGVNPLETSFAELDSYFENKNQGGYEAQQKSYSEFLYGLERQDDITPEERESYIGIYRLIHQVEKSEGAAIGTVLSESAELSFNNLLAAVRTKRLRGIDVKVDETFGRSEIVNAAKSITDQIATAYESERYLEESEELRKAAKARNESAQILRESGSEVSAENLLAIESLLGGDENLYSRLSKRPGLSGKIKETAKRLLDSLPSEDFDSEYEKAGEDLSEESKAAVLEADTYLDVRALNLVSKQLSLLVPASGISRDVPDRDYIIPLEVGEDILKVRLSFRSSGEENSLRISTVMDEEEVVSFLELSSGNLEGYVSLSGEKGLKKLKAAVDIFGETLKAEESLKDLKIGDIPLVTGTGTLKIPETIKISNKSKDADVVNSDGSERRILLQVAKAFLQSVERSHHEN